MTMQINENYAQSRTGCAERMKEKQAVPNVEKAKETEETKKAAESQNSDLLTEPQDVYISSEESAKESAGVYRIGQDENGSRKIFFDDPEKADRADQKEDTEGRKLKADENSKKSRKKHVSAIQIRWIRRLKN